MNFNLNRIQTVTDFRLSFFIPFVLGNINNSVFKCYYIKKNDFKQSWNIMIYLLNTDKVKSLYYKLHKLVKY